MPWDNPTVYLNMYYFHGLVIKLIWPTARQNKAKQENQTENQKMKKDRAKESAASQLPEKQDMLKNEAMWQNVD